MLESRRCFSGTYFAQNEVFEDEAVGEVALPLSSLGTEHRVYLGKSIEGVLRKRDATKLALLFQRSYVCIRRFRSTDGRLLPLILDPPRLLKHKASPSALAMQVGLARPMVAPIGAAPAQTDTLSAVDCLEQQDMGERMHVDADADVNADVNADDDVDLEPSALISSADDGVQAMDAGHVGVHMLP